MKFAPGLIFALLLLTCLNFSRCRNSDSGLVDTVACPIDKSVNEFITADAYYQSKVRLKTQILYRATELKRKWLKRRRPTALYKAFVRELAECEVYGLNPSDYHLADLERAVDTLYQNRKNTTADVTKLELRITASFFLYSTHLIEGRIRYPGAKEFFWKRGMPLENDIVLLLKMKDGDDFRQIIKELQPSDPQYAKLQQALAWYRERQPADTMPALPANLKLKPGNRAHLLPLLRRRLALSGDYSRQVLTATDSSYSDKMVEAVKQFQTRHGLTPDGDVGQQTVKWLNMPVTRRIRLISLNLERMRWYPHIPEREDRIVINVPEYMLRVYDGEREKLSMRVVLGSEYNPTPVFSDTLKYIVFSPEWRVPQSIFLKEFLPRLQEDPAVFDPERFIFLKNGKEIDPLDEPWTEEPFDSTAYTVIENPGERNSLGAVKFIMPNDFSIYLHDTPAVQLFQKQRRALSHGCIRVQNPVALAAYLLADQKSWNENRIKESMKAGKPVKANLTKPYPVYIVYRTAWVDDDGHVNFRDDVYGHDARQLARLKENTISAVTRPDSGRR